MTKIDYRNQLKRLLVKKKISVAKVSRRADISQQTLYNYLAGRSEIRSDLLQKIFNILL